MGNKFVKIYSLVWFIGAVIYCLSVYFYPIKNSDTYITIAGLLWVISLFVIVSKEKKNSIFHAEIIIYPVFAMAISYAVFKYCEEKRIYQGPSIIAKCLITSTKISGSGGKGCVRISYGNIDIGKKSDRINISDYYPDMIGKYVYIMYNPDWESKYYTYNSQPSDSIIKKINNFAFYFSNQEYTYHDYSLKNPDFVYCHVGFNIIHKAVHTSINTKDSTTILIFNDICDNLQKVKGNIKNYTSIPDTFLVFHNINEKMSKEFTVCAPEVNTPENWAKISDYGYIFHYDVYSKEEIESQCPQIRNYVEKYKERMDGK